ncbi:acyl-CoA thioesteraes 11 [Pseudohyphozyma bogoriensis]|nr:acyl-CoA thioesteraes 11 [Pseudohyphozyma bogoriensis]
MPASSTNQQIGIALGFAAAAAGGLAAVKLGGCGSSGGPGATTKKVKKVADSSVSFSYKISPEHCDEHGRVYGGELLKLIDVAAGVVAAKHAGGPCLTISADRVIFLQEIKVSDVVHISSAVNRAWGSSMEIGVRVTRETPGSRERTYCCHAYLTFVAKPTPPPPATLLTSLLTTLRLTAPATPTRASVPEISPTSNLESKRYLLAGRRRAHRIQGRDKYDQLLKEFRGQVLEIEREVRERDEAGAEEGKEDAIQGLQKELIVEAYMKGDPDVKVEGDWVIASIEGFMDPVRLPRKEIERASTQRGHGGYRRLSIRREESDGVKPDGSSIPRSLEDHSPLELADTMVKCLWIVRPQHCNSKNILFGGTLMRWIEETSTIAARRVSFTPWSSAAIDSLTFRSAVLPGEVVYVRSCVVKVWDSSVECYAVAMAEDRNSAIPKIRLVSEAFFSLVAIDPNSGRPSKGGLRHVRIPEGPARRVEEGADKRREERLMDKKILLKVYA